MGNWRNRPPRRNYYRDKAQRSPPRYHYPEPPNSDLCQDGVPSWEKKFCFLIGSVPWSKIVDTKKYMYCHGNIINWDDSAGEEAFHSAKKLFWAKINGLPCDIPLPDPDIYIDQIDWDPHIDPKLIKDLDREYFAPNEDEDGNVDNNNKNTATFLGGHNIIVDNPINPWECNNIQDNGAWKEEAQGWNQWDNCNNNWTNVDHDANPWESNYTPVNGAQKDSAWGDSGDKSWGWNQEMNLINQQSCYRDKGYNPRECGGRGVGGNKDKGRGINGDNSFGWNNWETRNLDNGGNAWECGQGQGRFKTERGRRDYGGNSWGWKQREDHTNEPSWELRKSSGDWEARSEGVREREGSQPYPSVHKSSRFQGDHNQTGHYWSKGRAKKRVSFD